jgi:hypothetical protein
VTASSDRNSPGVTGTVGQNAIPSQYFTAARERASFAASSRGASAEMTLTTIR